MPLRVCPEFGFCHRNEPSGSLHGIMRVRGFTCDDAHIFCTEAQVQDEASQFIDGCNRFIGISVSTRFWSNFHLAGKTCRDRNYLGQG